MTKELNISLNDTETILKALRAEDAEFNAELRASARSITDRVFGREVFMRGLVEISNICSRNCMYCGLYTGNDKQVRYRMEPDEIVERAHLVEKCKLPTMVMQSGEDAYPVDVLVDIVKRIKAETNLVLTLSLGELKDSDYAALREAGADRYLLRHETADADLYAKLHPGFTLQQRIDCLKSIRKYGYELGSGFMIGLPGQTAEMMVKDLQLLVDLKADMCGVGPFIPHPETELAGADDGDVEVVLNVISLLRHLLPGCNLPATTALDTMIEDGRERGLAAGANVVMPVLTPLEVKDKYLLYPNKRCATHNPVGCVGCSAKRLHSVGYEVSKEQGWSKQKQYN